MGEYDNIGECEISRRALRQSWVDFYSDGHYWRTGVKLGRLRLQAESARDRPARLRD